MNIRAHQPWHVNTTVRLYSILGFRADGAHLPTPPPIPEAIARSLQYHLNRGGGGGNAQQQQLNKNVQHSFNQQQQQAGKYQPTGSGFNSGRYTGN